MHSLHKWFLPFSAWDPFMLSKMFRETIYIGHKWSAWVEPFMSMHKLSGRTKYDDINGPLNHLCCHEWSLRTIYAMTANSKSTHSYGNKSYTYLIIRSYLTDTLVHGVAANTIVLRINWQIHCCIVLY